MTDDSRSLLANVQEELAAIAEPLQRKRAAIDARLAELEQEAHGLREARNNIAATLRRLDPSEPSYRERAKARGPQAARGNADPRKVAADRERKRQAVLAYIEGHDWPEGIIATHVYEEMRDDATQEAISTGKVLAYLREFHEQGILRAERKMRGGAVVYQLVRASDNGAA